TALPRPRAGPAAFGGARIGGLAAHQVVDRGIACVPEGRQIFPLLSVEDNLLLGSYLPRTRPRRQENLARVYELFPRPRGKDTLAGVKSVSRARGERRGQEAGTLSGGEQQMLAIGRALMSEPR